MIGLSDREQFEMSGSTRERVGERWAFDCPAGLRQPGSRCSLPLRAAARHRELARVAPTSVRRVAERLSGRGGQHLHHPDPEGRREACRRAPGRRARRSRSSSTTSSTSEDKDGLSDRKVSSLGSGFVIDPVRPDRHQQSRHRRRRRDHHQLHRRHQAEGRQDARQGHQDRPRAAQGRAEEAAAGRRRSATPPRCGSATG